MRTKADPDASRSPSHRCHRCDDGVSRVRILGAARWLKILINFAIRLLVYAAVMLLIDRRQLREDVSSIELVIRPSRTVRSAS